MFFNLIQHIYFTESRMIQKYHILNIILYSTNIEKEFIIIEHFSESLGFYKTTVKIIIIHHSTYVQARIARNFKRGVLFKINYLIQLHTSNK